MGKGTSTPRTELLACATAGRVRCGLTTSCCLSPASINRTFREGGLVVMGLILCFVLSNPARLVAAEAPIATTTQEGQAAILFNVALFVGWPTNTLPMSETQFCIGILGTNPPKTALERTVKNQTYDGHPVRIRTLAKVEDVARYHVQMVVIAESQERRLDSILAALGNSSVLTVSEIEHFAERGGMVGLATEPHTEFSINLDRMRQAGLTVSSRMLGLRNVDRVKSWSDQPRP